MTNYIEQIKNHYGEKVAGLNDKQTLDWYYNNHYQGKGKLSKNELYKRAGLAGNGPVQALRNNFPETVGMDDAEVLDWYYGNHYQGKGRLSREELFKRAGVALPKTQQAENSGGFLDTLNRGADAVVQGIVDTGGGIAEGALRTGQGAVNAFRKLADLEPLEMAPRGLTPGVNPDSSAYGVGSLGGELLALEAGGGPVSKLAGKALKFAPRAVRSVSEMLQPVASDGITKAVARGAGRGLVRGAPAGALQAMIFNAENTDSSSGRDARLGATIGGGISAAIEGVSPLFAPLANNPVVRSAASRVYRNYIEPTARRARQGLGTLTPEQVAARESVLQGRPANFGDVVSDGTGAQPEDIAKAIYGRASDVNPAGLEAEAVLNRDAIRGGGDFLSALRGDADEGEIDDILLSTLESKKSAHKAQAKQMYGVIGEQTRGVPVDFGNTRQQLAAEVKEAAQAGDTAKVRELNAEINKLKNIQEKGFSIDESFDLLPADIKEQVSAELADTSRVQSALDMYSMLGEQAADAVRANDNRSAKRLFARQKAIQNDIDTAIKSNADEAISKDWEEAKRYYKDRVVPYVKNNTVKRFLSEDLSPEKITESLKSPKNAKILEHMTPGEKNLFLHQYLAKSARDTETQSAASTIDKIISRYEKMPAELKKRLVSPELEAQINELRKLKNLTSKSRLRAAPPPTGAQNTGMLRNAIKNSGKLGIGTGGLIGTAFYSPASLPAVAGSMLYANRLANLYRAGQSNLEYSPLLRQLYRENRAPSSSELLNAINLPLTAGERQIGKGINAALNRSEMLKQMGIGRAIPRGALALSFGLENED